MDYIWLMAVRRKLYGHWMAVGQPFAFRQEISRQHLKDCCMGVGQPCKSNWTSVNIWHQFWTIVAQASDGHWMLMRMMDVTVCMMLHDDVLMWFCVWFCV